MDIQQLDGIVSGNVQTVASVEGSLTGGVLVIGGGLDLAPVYDGTYHVTPSSEQVVLPTSMRMLAKDIVVDPIPSNYGLISWDGARLMIS